MEKRDFIYHFTNIFLSEAVKETIIIENWEEKKDFDPRYEEYVKFFLAMKIKYNSGRVSEEDIKSELVSKKIELVKNFNRTLLSHFQQEIIKRGGSKNLVGQIIPKNIFFDDTININVLKSFRALEERI